MFVTEEDCIEKQTQPHSSDERLPCAPLGWRVDVFHISTSLAWATLLFWNSLRPTAIRFTPLTQYDTRWSQVFISALTFVKVHLRFSLNCLCGLHWGCLPYTNSPYSICIGMQASSKRTRWPTRLSWCFVIIDSMLVILAICNTLLFGTCNHHDIFSIIHKHHWWNHLRCWIWLWQVVQVSHPYNNTDSTHA